MYYYGFGYDSGYLLLVIVSTLLGVITQAYINPTYNEWSAVPPPRARRAPRSPVACWIPRAHRRSA